MDDFFLFLYTKPSPPQNHDLSKEVNFSTKYISSIIWLKVHGLKVCFLPPPSPCEDYE